MSTTAREDRTPGSRTSQPATTTDVVAPPKLRRRPALVVAAVIITALGSLIGAWAWSASTDTQEVLAARETIHQGETIEAGDLQRIRISRDPLLTPLPAAAFDDIVGQRAALDISEGGLLTDASTSDEPLPPQGQTIVGIALTPAQVPAMPLYGGDRVRIVTTPGDEGTAAASSPQFTVAEVVSTAIDGTTGNTVVNVLVPYAEAGVLAAQAATGNVALVLDSGAE